MKRFLTICAFVLLAGVASGQQQPQLSCEDVNKRLQAYISMLQSQRGQLEGQLMEARTQVQDLEAILKQGREKEKK